MKGIIKKIGLINIDMINATFAIMIYRHLFLSKYWNVKKMYTPKKNDRKISGVNFNIQWIQDILRTKINDPKKNSGGVKYSFVRL